MNSKITFERFTLPVCIYAFAFAFFNLSSSILLVNSSSYSEHVVGYILATITAGLMIITWVLAFYGALKSSYIAVLLATILWSMFIMFWVMTMLVACVEKSNVTLVDYRGPESFWLVQNQYYLDEISISYEYYSYEQHYLPAHMQQLNGAETAEDDDGSAGSDDDDGGGGPRVRMSKVTDFLSVKWLLIVFNFSVFACIVIAAWYVLICYYKQLNYIRICGPSNAPNDLCCSMLEQK